MTTAPRRPPTQPRRSPSTWSPIPTRAAAIVYTHPKDGDYLSDLSVAFGADIDLTDTTVGLALKTADFPRD